LTDANAALSNSRRHQAIADAQSGGDVLRDGQLGVPLGSVRSDANSQQRKAADV
jgi:hypothetical protein